MSTATADATQKVAAPVKEREPLFSKKHRELVTDPLDDNNPIAGLRDDTLCNLRLCFCQPDYFVAEKWNSIKDKDDCSIGRYRIIGNNRI